MPRGLVVGHTQTTFTGARFPFETKHYLFSWTKKFLFAVEETQEASVSDEGVGQREWKLVEGVAIHAKI